MYAGIYEQIDQFAEIKMLSFTGGKMDLLVPQELTYLKINSRNSLHFQTENMANVYTYLNHIETLTYPSFLVQLSKFIILFDNAHIKHARDIYGFFMNSSNYYEGALYKR